MIPLIEQQPGYGPLAPVPILQWEREFEVLLELYRRLLPSHILEIGTYHGGTLFHWLQNAKCDARVVSLDSYEVGVDNRSLYQEWVRCNVELIVLEGNSHHEDTVGSVAQCGPYDWLFIDAGHYLHEVTLDWELYSPLVRRGGTICFHDILLHPVHPEIEVAHLWGEIKNNYRTFEIVADRDAEWGGIGVVFI